MAKRMSDEALGEMLVKLGIDKDDFVRGMKEAEAASKNFYNSLVTHATKNLDFASSETRKFQSTFTTSIHEANGAAEEFSSRGIVAMVRGFKQLTEGSSGLLTTIPRLSMLLGGGGQLALGLGVLAVAARTLYKNWDDLTESLQNTEAFQNVTRQLEAMADLMLQNAGAPTIEDFRAGAAAREEARESKKTDEEKVKAGKRIVEESRTEEEIERGKRFKTELDKYGGKRLFEELFEPFRSNMAYTTEQREKAKADIHRNIERGVRGEKMIGTEFGPSFGNRLKGIDLTDESEELRRSIKIATERETEAFDKEEKFHHEEYLQGKEIAARKLRMMREEDEVNKQKAKQVIEDKIEALERQKREQAGGYREYQLMSGTYGVQGDTRQMMAKMMQDTGKEVQLSQLHTQQAMQKRLDEMHLELKKLNRTPIGAVVQ